jgi:hypothetical protein
MFESAIEKITAFTRPLHTISRTYGGLIIPGTGTLFFVNGNGFAITCKHVAQLIISAEQINQQYTQFKEERRRVPNDNKYNMSLKGLELKYKYNKETTVQLKTNFVNCFNRLDQIVCHAHPVLDLAIIECKGFDEKLYSGHASFIKDSATIKQGKYLCRFGYPFPEFTNFKHNSTTDDIEWTNTGNSNSPTFPIDGIITRFTADATGINGIEMSTPGLRGQSGGPLFDAAGNIYGMQFATNHLHLGFDVTDTEIVSDGAKRKISNHPFLHTGLCVHVDKIKEFLTLHKVDFTEEDGY